MLVITRLPIVIDEELQSSDSARLKTTSLQFLIKLIEQFNSRMDSKLILYMQMNSTGLCV